MWSREPEPEHTSFGDIASHCNEILRLVDNTVSQHGIEGVDDDTIQCLNTLAIRLYAARRQAGNGPMPIVGAQNITATEAVIAAAAMLEAVNLDVFELSLWGSLASDNESSS